MGTYAPIKVAKGSRMKLAFSDGSYVEWRAESETTLDHALETIDKLTKLSPEHIDMQADEALAVAMSCQGHAACQAPIHHHGCYADLGNCDEPEDHRRSVGVD